MRTLLALGLLACAASGCKKAPPQQASAHPARPAPVARPPFPAATLSTNARRDCFPADFVASRVRLRTTIIELCGVSAGAPLCYEVDPIQNRVERTVVADAPASAPSEPALDGPFLRAEIASRGWRATTRGGALSVTGPGGNNRTVNAQNFGMHSYENTVFLPWTDGWYAVMVGVKGADLGASAIIDPHTLRMVSHAALLFCGADGGV